MNKKRIWMDSADSSRTFTFLNAFFFFFVESVIDGDLEVTSEGECL